MVILRTHFSGPTAHSVLLRPTPSPLRGPIDAALVVRDASRSHQPGPGM